MAESSSATGQDVEECPDCGAAWNLEAEPWACPSCGLSVDDLEAAEAFLLDREDER